jgi:hypothetical protein
MINGFPEAKSGRKSARAEDRAIAAVIKYE